MHQIEYLKQLAKRMKSFIIDFNHIFFSSGTKSFDFFSSGNMEKQVPLTS